ncbi:MAG: sigma-70 family RNA polymerase sigma factor [Elusimicrobia bacterium]|nr:sigma-70 family RNA polymerase sigma factor [Candidatus Liberimonas magnetica]
MEIHEISKDLLIKASKGDLDAFEELYKAASALVYNVALKVTANIEDAQEVTQEVFLKLFKNLKSFKFQSSFKTWVYRITVNTALNYKIKASKQTSRHVQLEENMDNQAIYENQVEKGMDHKSNEETVNNLLNSLGPEYRVCIVLREMQGLSYREIAETLDINVNTLRSRLKRAREALLKRGMENAVR